MGGDGYEANNKCGKATSQSKCENNGCSWLVTEDPSDCELTTTSEPWMGEKQYEYPFNPYKASRKNSALSSAMAKKGTPSGRGDAVWRVELEQHRHHHTGDALSGVALERAAVDCCRRRCVANLSMLRGTQHQLRQ